MNRSTDAVTFLSLGPGDPELLTLKAVRLLREADVVMIPATQGSDGQVSSRAQTIIAEWVAEEQMHLYPLPMSKNREAALQTYDTMVNDAAALFREGRRVVIAVEGDVSIYASIHYVLYQLQADGIPVAQTPSRWYSCGTSPRNTFFYCCRRDGRPVARQSAATSRRVAWRCRCDNTSTAARHPTCGRRYEAIAMCRCREGIPSPTFQY